MSRRERIEVLERLVLGSGEIAPGALLFDDQNPGPEQIDEPVAVVELILDVRFIAGNAASTYVEVFEELVVEALRVRFLVAGLLESRSGAVTFTDQDITATEAHSLVGRGISLVPEGRQVFGRMSVEENLILGAYSRPARRRFRALLRAVSAPARAPQPTGRNAVRR